VFRDTVQQDAYFTEDASLIGFPCRSYHFHPIISIYNRCFPLFLISNFHTSFDTLCNLKSGGRQQQTLLQITKICSVLHTLRNNSVAIPDLTKWKLFKQEIFLQNIEMFNSISPAFINQIVKGTKFVNLHIFLHLYQQNLIYLFICCINCNFPCRFSCLPNNGGLQK
jgi:hypothetical protein